MVVIDDIQELEQKDLDYTSIQSPKEEMYLTNYVIDKLQLD
jgi:hypothetical protein